MGITFVSILEWVLFTPITLAKCWVYFLTHGECLLLSTVIVHYYESCGWSSGSYQRLSFAHEAQRTRRAKRRYCQDLSAGKEQTQPEPQAVWLLVQHARDFWGDFGVSTTTLVSQDAGLLGCHWVLCQGSELHKGFWLGHLWGMRSLCIQHSSQGSPASTLRWTPRPPLDTLGPLCWCRKSGALHILALGSARTTLLFQPWPSLGSCDVRKG